MVVSAPPPLAVAVAAGVAVLAVGYLRRCQAAAAKRTEETKKAYSGKNADDDQRKGVAAAYEATVMGTASCCVTAPGQQSRMKIGYSDTDRALGDASGTDLGLGCGTPVELAALRPGETACDLGAGAGFDVLLAAKAVGPAGKAYGVDMVPAMLEKARAAAKAAGVHNAKYLLGEIEHLPLPDASVDVVISNCVINLSPDKRQVCAEAYRILRPGGRIAVSDVVATAELPERLKTEAALACWVAGAPRPEDLAGALRDAGFEQVVIEQKPASREFIKDWLPGSGCEDYVVSANVTATKPAPPPTHHPAHTPPAGYHAGSAASGVAAHMAEAGAEAAAKAAAKAKRAAARAAWAAQVGIAPAPAAPPPPATNCSAKGGWH